MAVPFQDGLSQFFDDSGNPLSGGLVYTYAAGTTEPATTYTTRTGNVEHENPLELDSAGRASIWLTRSVGYRFDIKTAAGSLVDSVDGIVLTDGTGAAYRDALSVVDFGAAGDGVTDDTAAIQAAIDAAEATEGGVVYFPPGNYLISAQLNVNQNNVSLLGSGQGGFAPGITALRDSAASRIFWGGASAPTSAVVEFRTPAATTEKRAGGVSKLMLDAMNLCGHGLRLVSWMHGRFDDLVIYGATVAQIRLTTTAETLSAQPYDCIRNVFYNVYTTCKNLPSNNSHGVWMDREPTSPGTGNSCFNTFTHCNLTKGEGALGYGVLLGDTDNNMFFSCTTEEFVFGSEDDFGHARYNMVVACQADATAKAGTSGGSSSSNNYVIGLNKSNGKGVITVESGGGGSSDATIYAEWPDGTKRMPKGSPASGAAVTSQLLTHYEEGTWTVGVVGSTVAGSGTVSASAGSYVRIGRVVQIQGHINYSAHSGFGDLVITGLPYAAKAGQDRAVISVRASSLTYSGELVGLIENGASVINLQSISSGASQSNVALDAAASITFSGNYLV